MSTSNQGTPVRLGIIGCGAITENAHLPAALTSPWVEMVAISDADPARLKYMESQYALEGKGIRDYRELISKVEAVVLALPNHLHEPIGLDFLRNGIHVLCEKPLALTTEQCQRMCHAARSTGTVLAVGYMTRFYPSTILTKHLLDTNCIGTVRSFEYEFGTEGGWAPLSGYNLSRATSGGGVLVVSGSHFLDRMLYLFGNVRVRKYQDDSRGGVEANCMIEVSGNVNGVEYEGTIRLSKTHKLSNRLSITGDRGRLTVREGQAQSVTFCPAGSDLSHEVTYQPETGIPSAEDYYRVQLEDFIRAIQMRGAPKVDGVQGLASVALIEQCYTAVASLDDAWSSTTIDRLLKALPQENETVSTKP